MTGKMISSTLFVLLSLTQFAAAGKIAFKPAQSYAVGTQPISVVVGDFNGDGKPDLAILNNGSSNVSILLGNGDGTFQPARNFDEGTRDSTIWGNLATGDFNGDGKLDLAVFVGPNWDYAPGEVHILLGNGDGTFQVASVTALDPHETVAAVADFNGDKKADLVVNLTDPSFAASGVAVRLGNGDGTFQTAMTAVTGSESVLRVADVSNDGKPDLAIGIASAVQIMLGRGDGTFSQGGQAVLAAGFVAQGVWTADLNGDGNADLIVDSRSIVQNKCIDLCSSGENQHVSLFLGKGKGTFGAEHIFATGGGTLLGSNFLGTLVFYNGAGDFDGDNKLDIAATSSTTYPKQSVLDISLGNGDGTFASPIGLPDPGNVAVVADLNGDHLIDLVVMDSANNDVDVLLNVTPAFSITASASSLTVSAGQQVTDSLSFTGVNGFSSSLQLSCSVTGPAPVPTCSLSPATITAEASASTSTLTIGVPATEALVQPHTRWLPPVYALVLPLAFVGLGFRWKRVNPRYKRWLLGASLAMGGLMCTACGGGNTNTQSVHQPQSYMVQVTATSDALTKIVQISLTVQ